MEAAVYDQTTIEVVATAQQQPSAFAQARLRTTGSVMRFDGWTKLFANSEDSIVPDVKSGDPLSYQDLFAAQKFTQPPPRYNDASLVKELEKRGIGRPSTYASIISVIEDRSYVERDQKRFVPTAIGRTVNDFLVKYFPGFMEYDFTAEMEEDLDRISRGEKNWQQLVKAFYQPLAKIIEDVVANADRMQIPVEKTGRVCPICGETEGGEVVIRSGKYGKFYSCSRFPECEYTENHVEKVDGLICPLCQQGEVVVKKTRWGKNFFGCSTYPGCDWASWKKPQPGEIVTVEEWQVLQQARAERKAKKQAEFKGKKTKSKKPARSRKKKTKK
jgi:DNA topoisomerase-1